MPRVRVAVLQARYAMPRVRLVPLALLALLARLAPLELLVLLARVALLAVLAMPRVRVVRVALLVRVSLLLGILMRLLQAGGLLCLAGCRVRHRLGGVWGLR